MQHRMIRVIRVIRVIGDRAHKSQEGLDIKRFQAIEFHACGEPRLKKSNVLTARLDSGHFEDGRQKAVSSKQ